MKLSARCLYAAQVLVELAQHNQNSPISASILSQRTGVTPQFIEQILKALKKSGVTQSFRGTTGGHCLAMPAEKITLGEVVRLMDGGFALTVCCSDNPQECPRQSSCLIKRAWQRIAKSLEHDLDAISLSDLVQDTTNYLSGKYLE